MSTSDADSTKDAKDAYEDKMNDSAPTGQAAVPTGSLNDKIRVNILCFNFLMTKKTRAKFIMIAFLAVMLLDFGADEIVSRFVSMLGISVYDDKKIVDNVFGYVSFIETFLLAGVTAKIAMARGKGDMPLAGRLIKLSLIVTVLYGLISMVVLLLAQDSLIAVVSGSKIEIGSIALAYYIVCAIGRPISFSVSTFFGVALGLFELPLLFVVSLLSCIIQVTSAALFLFVFKTGLVGDSIATLCGDLFLCIFMLYKLGADERLKSLNFYKINKTSDLSDALLSSSSTDIAEIAQPASFWPTFTETKTFFAYNGILLAFEAMVGLPFLFVVPLYARLGKIPLAAMSAVSSVTSIVQAIGTGFGMAITMIGGVFYAQKAFEALHFIIKRISRIAASVAIVFCIIAVAAPTWLITAFYNDADTSDTVVSAVKAILGLIVPYLIVSVTAALSTQIMYATDSYYYMFVVGVPAAVAFGIMAAVGFNSQSYGLIFAGLLAMQSIIAVCFVAKYLLFSRPRYAAAEMRRCATNEDVMRYGVDAYRHALAISRS